MALFRKSVLAAALLLALSGAALAQEAVIVTVNDHPVTGFDIEQRIKLLEFLGERNPAKLVRKAVANEIINDFVKFDEAKRQKIDPTEKDIDERMNSMAKNMKTDEAGLKSKLASAGLTMTALRQYAGAQMAFGRLLQVKYREKVAVDPAEVDKKFAAVKADINSKVAKIESDPRRVAVKVLELQEINFPAEGNDPQLLRSRAVEAGQVAQKISSCGNIKAATSGVFNVQIGRKIEADSRKIPPPLMAQINAKGVGHVVGPIRYPKGVQLLAFCGTRTVTPPPIKVTMPTREQIQTMALNEKYAAVEEKYVAILRKTAVIEYKDPSYAQ
jgi:peptidyl-prolyl cis-trans isomerase SurA